MVRMQNNVLYMTQTCSTASFFAHFSPLVFTTVRLPEIWDVNVAIVNKGISHDCVSNR